jgi:aspartate kinase
MRIIHDAFGLAELPEASAVTEQLTSLELAPADALEGLHVQSVECDTDQAEVKVSGLADRPGEAGRLFQVLADAGVNLDIVLQNSCAYGISVTVGRDDAERARKAVEAASPPFSDQPVEIKPDIAKVSVSGVGLRSYPGAASRVFGILAEDGINIQMIGTSEVKISVIVAEQDAERAGASLRKELEAAS